MNIFLKPGITIQEERVTSEEYIDFLKRTDLGSQYPKERFVTAPGVDRNYTRLMEKAHQLACGEKEIAVYLNANENAVPIYKKYGMKRAGDVMRS